MNDSFLQNILGGGKDNPTEDIVSILVFVVFGIAVFLKNIIAAKRQQKQQQNRPVPNTSVQRASVKVDKAKIQKERVEQFLDSILQPKKAPQPKPSVPEALKIQMPKSPYQKTAEVPLQVPVIKKSQPQYESKISQSSQSPSFDISKNMGALDLSSIDYKQMNLTGIQVELENEGAEHLIYRDKSKKKAQGFSPFFANPKDLRNAIIYSEILGKPISMRES